MSVTRFEKMRLDEVSSQAVVTPWPKPGFNVPVMPAGLMQLPSTEQVEVQINHMMAAMFAAQMGAAAEITISWALEQARAFRNKTLAEFGALVRFAQNKASQQGLFDLLGRQITQACGESSLDFSDKRRDLAASILKLNPLAVQVFVLETLWASEWMSHASRNTKSMSHPAVPSLLATERRIDAELRGVLKKMIDVTAASYGSNEIRRAASDLRAVYGLTAQMAAHFAASYTSLTEIIWATEPFATDRRALFASFEGIAGRIWARPTDQLPRLVQFLSGVNQGDLLLWMAADVESHTETVTPFLKESA